MVTVYCEDDPDFECYCDCEDYKCEEEIRRRKDLLKINMEMR